MDLCEIFQACLTDGRQRGFLGAPLGEDRRLAFEIDWILQAYECDAVIETGTYDGDTTEYLARAYAHLPVWTCEVDAARYDRARTRLSRLSNVVYARESSPKFVARTGHFSRPFYFLDAHWYDYWPLLDELQSIHKGIVCIHDFDVGHPDFDFDSYNGVACGPDLVRAFRPIYGNKPDRDDPTSLVPAVRRIGRGYLVIGLDDLLEKMPYVRRLI